LTKTRCKRRSRNATANWWLPAAMPWAPALACPSGKPTGPTNRRTNWITSWTSWTNWTCNLYPLAEKPRAMNQHNGNAAEPSNARQDPRLQRYVRRWRYPPLGAEGQQRLLNSRVLLCGCGALGTVLANTLALAGVCFLRIVDRDFLELSNLQRQVLFDE